LERAAGGPGPHSLPPPLPLPLSRDRKSRGEASRVLRYLFSASLPRIGGNFRNLAEGLSGSAPVDAGCLITRSREIRIFCNFRFLPQEPRFLRRSQICWTHLLVSRCLTFLEFLLPRSGSLDAGDFPLHFPARSSFLLLWIGILGRAIVEASRRNLTRLINRLIKGWSDFCERLNRVTDSVR